MIEQHVSTTTPAAVALEADRARVQAVETRHGPLVEAAVEFRRMTL